MPNCKNAKHHLGHAYVFDSKELMRVCLILAFVTLRAFADTDGCTVGPDGTQTCPGDPPLGDATSLLQQMGLKKLERAQEEVVNGMLMEKSVTRRCSHIEDPSPSSVLIQLGQSLFGQSTQGNARYSNCPLCDEHPDCPDWSEWSDWSESDCCSEMDTITCQDTCSEIAVAAGGLAKESCRRGEVFAVTRNRRAIRTAAQLIARLPIGPRGETAPRSAEKVGRGQERGRSLLPHVAAERSAQKNS
jgi:hypothetical protein